MESAGEGREGDVRFHSQNLNEKGAGTLGSMWRHGRCWIGNSGFEWVFGWRPLGAELELATHGHALAGNISLFFFSLYWHWENHRVYWWLQNALKRPDQKYGNGRQIGFRFYEEYIWIDLWNDPMESRHDDPWWWHISIVPKDLLLGRSKYSERSLRKSRVEIPMPEGVYPASVEIQEATWKRPRWPWPLRVIRAEIIPDKPVPFPGKGENSWDCGEDATHAMTCCAKNEQEAVAAFVKSILNDRYRHGGKHWRLGAAPSR